MKVLIVESAQHVREELGLQLRARGHEVIECMNGRDALRRVDSYDADPLIAAEQLPDMTGAQIVEQLRRNSSHASLPVLVLKEARMQHVSLTVH